MVSWDPVVGLVAAGVVVASATLVSGSVETRDDPRTARRLLAVALVVGAVGTAFGTGGLVSLLPTLVATALVGTATGLLVCSWAIARRLRTNGAYERATLGTKLSVTAAYWTSGVLGGVLVATFALTILVGPLA
jgi:hypothetical protein